MIDRDIVRARIRRSEIQSLAGEYYLNEGSKRLEGLSAAKSVPALLFGIYKSALIWTAISADDLIYQTGDSNGILPIAQAGALIHDYQFEVGKDVHYEFAQIGERDRIWVISPQVTGAILNVINLLELWKEQRAAAAGRASSKII